MLAMILMAWTAAAVPAGLLDSSGVRDEVCVTPCVGGKRLAAFARRSAYALELLLHDELARSRR